MIRERLIAGRTETEARDSSLCDEAAFHAFYLRTAPALRAYLRRVGGDGALADDALQESFCRLLQSPVAAAGDEQRRAWLYRTATNLLRDHWRRRRREAPLENPAGGSTRWDENGAVAVDFARLKPGDRALLWLAYVEGCDHREIAERLGKNVMSIRVMLFRARRRFAALLRGEVR